LPAAVIVALWPSLVLHTTQLVKDPLFILEMLAFILVLNILLTRVFPNTIWLLAAGFGVLLSLLIWKTRSEQIVLVIGSIFLAIGMCVFRQIRERRVLLPNLAGMALILAVTVGGILVVPVFRTSDHPGYRNRPPLSKVSAESLHWWQLAEYIGVVRQRFVQTYPEFGSNIDTDVQIRGSRDLVRYLPRAAAIGLLAPFPRMWFEKGTSVGAIGRRLSGLETILMYIVEALALISVWRGRRKLSVWFLFSIALMGVVALGLVVINVGTLYRLRLTFLVLFVILASAEMRLLVERIRCSSLHRRPIAEPNAPTASSGSKDKRRAGS
jgi:hypothetical protein